MDRRIPLLLDRIAHHTTEGADLESSAAALRRVLNGTLPSELLRQPNRKHRSFDTLHAEIDALRQLVNDVHAAKEMSDREKNRQIKSLEIDLARLQAELDDIKTPVGGFYTRIQVSQIIDAQFTKRHGVAKALHEKNAALRRDGHDVPRITEAHWQRWQRDNRFPEWVIEQLRALTPNDLLPRARWSEDERQFLIRLYVDNPRRSNQQLAEACSRRFGRSITDCGIKGELDRLRKKGRVSPYRRLLA